MKYGLIGTGLLAAGGVGLGLRPTLRRASKNDLKTLDEVEYSILAAMTERVCPASGRFPSGVKLGVPEDLDTFLSTTDPNTTWEIKQALRLLENALFGLVVEGRFQTFSACDEKTQNDIIIGWQKSHLKVVRTAAVSIILLIKSTYFGNPDAYALVGYPGPPDFQRPGTSAPLAPSPAEIKP